MTKPALITETFNGLPIVFREDGYINMTKAAKHFGKVPNEFIRLPSTQAFLDAFASITGISRNALVVTKKGGLPGNGGTWLHPKLAVRAARWLDAHFDAWCDLMIDNILKGHIQTQVVVPTQEAIDVESVVAPFKARILDLEIDNHNKALRIDQLGGEVKRLQEEGFKGKVPDHWKTAFCYLVDSRHTTPLPPIGLSVSAIS